MPGRWKPVAVAAALAVLAAACGEGPGSVFDAVVGGSEEAREKAGGWGRGTGPVAIRYATFSAVPDHLDTLDRVVAAFEEAHPDITVEVEAAPLGEYFPRVEAQLATGDVPDVVETDYENFVRLASRGALADLGPHIADDLEFDAGAYYPRAYDAFARGDTQYGLPAAYTTELLFYNKDLFDAAGMSYPAASWTWEEEREAAAALTDPDAGVYGSLDGTGFAQFHKAAAQNGCVILDDGRVGIADRACVEALEHVLPPAGDGLPPSAPGAMTGADLFAEGKVAMLTTGTGMFGAFADVAFDWDVVVEPGSIEEAHRLAVDGVAVTADSDQQEAAYHWASFLTADPRAARIRVEAGWGLPPLTDASLFETFLSDGAPPENRHAVLEALESAVVPPVIERQAEMEDAVDAAIRRAATGEVSPWRALRQAGDELEALLGG